MMGYTHIAIGSAVAVSTSLLFDQPSPTQFLIASVAGAVGGIIVDVDVKDSKHPKITDGSRSRLAVIGFIILGLLIDLVFRSGIWKYLIAQKNTVLAGVIALTVLSVAGHHTDHHVLTHTLLFLFLITICISLIYPPATKFFVVGFIMHLLLDMLNYGYQGRGIMLLYPFKKTGGIALRICNASQTGNKVAYFIGIALFVLVSVVYAFSFKKMWYGLPVIILVAYLVVVLHFVRITSEQEIEGK